MSGFNDFVSLELPKRPFTDTDGAAGQILARSSNPLAARQLVWVDLPSTVPQRVAGATIGGHLALVLGVDGQAYPASCLDPLHQFVDSISLGAAIATYNVPVQRTGTLEHVGWDFVPGGLVFLGEAGALTQTLPVTAIFSKTLGVALQPTVISLDFQPAIFL